MMPSDQMSTLAPYSFCLTTSGAIQYGVPTIVARLDFWSVSLAQKPKSAAGKERSRTISAVPAVEGDRAAGDEEAMEEEEGEEENEDEGKRRRTDLDMASSVEQHVVALDVAVDDALRVEVLEAFAGLRAQRDEEVSVSSSAVQGESASTHLV